VPENVVPLAIVMPDVRMTLLEATGKKAAFLQETIDALGVTNARVVHERAEVAGQDHHAHRARYDVAVSRAVGRLNVLSELTVPFVREGGTVLCIKGDKAAEEVAEAKQALYHLHAQVVDQVRTPSGTVVVIEMMRATPRTYPRMPGEPKRKPIA
jgi:16S rRNA (guanine527-N7)-methyltransferase